MFSRSSRPIGRRRGLRLPLLMLALTLGAAVPVSATSPVRFERRVLGNGLRAVVSEQKAVPMVVLSLSFDAGSRRDPAGQEGLAALTADLLTEGTRRRSARQLSEEVDALGASLDAGADLDSGEISLTILRKDLDRGLELFFDVLREPSFPEAEVERRREAALAAIRAEQDAPGRLAARQFLSTVFGNEPYGHLPIGNVDSVARLRRSDLVAFHARRYRPEQAVLSVAGDITMEEVVRRFEKGLANWPAVAADAFPAPDGSPAAARTTRIDRPLTQTNLVLGHRGLARRDPDYLAVSVMNFILGGGGFTSRLMESVRVKGGLAYSVSSSVSANLEPGVFQVVLQTKNATAGEALRKTCDEIRRIRDEKVTEEELTAAQLYLTGSFPLRLDSNAKIASFLGQVEFFGLGEDYANRYADRIRAVTVEDVQRVARRLLDPERLQLVVVGKLGEIDIPDGAPCPAPLP